jgi:hypothetical protein
MAFGCCNQLQLNIPRSREDFHQKRRIAWEHLPNPTPSVHRLHAPVQSTDLPAA